MPDHEFPKLKPHPIRAGSAAKAEVCPPAPPMQHSRGEAGASPAYAELCTTSNYTFLTGASHPEEYITQAAGLGYRAVALTDTNTIAGVVRAHVAAKEQGLGFMLGVRLVFTDQPDLSLCVYPTDMPAYRRLCRLLTVGKRRAPKGQCHLTLDDLPAHTQGLLAVVIFNALPPDADAGDHPRVLRRLHDIFDDDRLSLAITVGYGPDDHARLESLARLGAETRTPLVATNNAYCHHPDRRMLQDVLVCIRHTCTLGEAGFRLHANAERHLKPAEEMHRLFAAFPQALARTLEVAERTRGFSLDQLRYEYPDEVVPPGATPMSHLRRLTYEGAIDRYPGGLPLKVRDQIEKELGLIDELRYAPYFLTVHDLVRFARSGRETVDAPPNHAWAEILCQGRGAAANSAVCYCLGVTAVDPVHIDVLFERFVSKERNEPPDIDIDFEHERREEVIQYIYRKYGRERAALTAEVITYRRRSAVRDVGKALGLSLDLVDRLAKDIEWWDQGGINPARLRELGLNPQDPTLQWLARLTGEILGFPRHLSQHVGGFVITRTPLCELVPVENAAMPDRTVIEWDKDDIDAVGMMKVDVLGLGMLTALRRCMDLIHAAHGRRFTLANIPPDDAPTYAMIQKADTVGVFQIESRAQMSMLPRLRPACFYDLVIEVAIVRPGPIQGDMVHPYLRRRSGQEPIPQPPHPAFTKVLGKTFGVPLFQEQCMALAVEAAGFTPGEADQLRRAMAAWKRKGDLIYRFGTKLISGMMSNGIPQGFAERCFEQIKGFSEYGFPESHAASFALLVYASAWLKCHYPAEFTAALLNSQPMGFYAPAQLVRDCREHGVEVRPIDTGYSAWDCTIEGKAVRLGMRLASGLCRTEADRVSAAVREAPRPLNSLLALWRAAGVKAGTMRRLAAADAFGSLGLTRQEALWESRLLRDDKLPLFEAAGDEPTEPAALPAVTPVRQVVLDYDSTGLSLKAHPVSFMRERLEARQVLPCATLRDTSLTDDGQLVKVSGLVLVRQRPGTASGVTFITLEDETGIANLIIWYRVYQKYRRAASQRMIIAHGKVQRQGDVVHLVVSRIEAVKDALPGLAVAARNFH